MRKERQVKVSEEIMKEDHTVREGNYNQATPSSTISTSTENQPLDRWNDAEGTTTLRHSNACVRVTWNLPSEYWRQEVQQHRMDDVAGLKREVAGSYKLPTNAEANAEPDKDIGVYCAVEAVLGNFRREAKNRKRSDSPHLPCPRCLMSIPVSTHMIESHELVMKLCMSAPLSENDGEPGEKDGGECIDEPCSTSVTLAPLLSVSARGKDTRKVVVDLAPGGCRREVDGTGFGENIFSKDEGGRTAQQAFERTRGSSRPGADAINPSMESDTRKTIRPRSLSYIPWKSHRGRQVLAPQPHDDTPSERRVIRWNRRGEAFNLEHCRLGRCKTDWSFDEWSGV
ncbi:hypothetical protein EDD15DRAFT_2203625 [Pisolithus albus]|nr:hypothetical protein EDD15DRAFT_2203625 [Pisolithus albus]